MQQEKPATPPSHHPRPPKIRKDLFCFDLKLRDFLLLRKFLINRKCATWTEINFYIKGKCFVSEKPPTTSRWREDDETIQQTDCSDSKTQLKSNPTCKQQNYISFKIIIGNTRETRSSQYASCDVSEEVEWRRGKLRDVLICNECEQQVSDLKVQLILRNEKIFNLKKIVFQSVRLQCLQGLPCTCNWGSFWISFAWLIDIEMVMLYLYIALQPVPVFT